MLKIRLLLIVGIINLLAFSARSQEMHGFVSSNYAGITGSQINPTSILTSKLFLDINALGLHVNADNNYVYLSKTDYKFSRFISGGEFPEHTVGEGTETRNFYDKYNKDLKNLFSQVRIMGPSAMFATGEQAFGFSTAYRTLLSGRYIPYEVAKFGIEGMDYSPLHKINFVDEHDFRTASMAFAEISATYSRVVYKHNRDHWTAGITVKGLFGTAGAFGYVDNIDYLVPNRDTLIVNNINGQMGMSLPVDYYNNDILIPGKLFRGNGLGIDIGVTYQKKILGYTNKGYSMPCEQPYEPYRYKIGFSILDLGRIKFKSDARLLDLVDASAYWENISSYNYNNLDELFKKISYEFSGDENALVKGNAFSIWLPTAFSTQVDVRVNTKVYLNATIVQPLVMGKAAVVRPSQVAVTPRFETDYFEVAMPFILYDYKHPRLGLSARLHKVVIGTDKLGGFFGMSDFYGMDFYVLVKFSFFKGQCRNFDKRFGCGNLEYKQKY